MPQPTWNHGAVHRFFARATRLDPHVVEHASYRVGEEAAHVVHAYLLRGPFDPSRDPDLSRRAKRGIARSTWAFVTWEEWDDEYGVSYFDSEDAESEARLYFDGFDNLCSTRKE